MPSGGTRAGRPSHVVGPHAGGPYVVAVDVDVTHVTIAAVGIGGERARPARSAELDDPPEPGARSPRRSSRPSRSCADLRAAGAPVGIGVSVPGTVDRRDGTVGFAPNLGWRDVRVRRDARRSRRRTSAGRASATTPTWPCSPSTSAGMRARLRRRRLPDGTGRRRRRHHRQRRAAARARRPRRRDRAQRRGPVRAAVPLRQARLPRDLHRRGTRCSSWPDDAHRRQRRRVARRVRRRARRRRRALRAVRTVADVARPGAGAAW